MRKDVVDLVTMMVGYTKRLAGCAGFTFDHTFKSERCEWHVSGQIHTFHPHESEVRMECWVKIDPTGGVTLGYSSTHHAIPFHTEKVQDVYESLPKLVQGMFLEYPKLAEICAPLLRAASTL